MNDRLRQIAPLLAMIAIIALFFAIQRNATAETEATYIDPPVFAIVGLAYALAGLTIMMRRRVGGWSILAAGLLLTMLALALIYIRTLSANQGWPLFQSDMVIDLIRAMLIGGGIFVLLGLALDWVDALTTGDERDE